MQEAIPGSGEAINYLLQKGKTITFVTNNTISSVDEQLHKLHKMQIDSKKHDLITPMHAIVEYLNSHHFNGNIWCIAMKSFKDYLREMNFKLIEEVIRTFYS